MTKKDLTELVWQLYCECGCIQIHKKAHMKLSEILSAIPGINRDFVYYLESKGYISPNRISKDRVDRRVYKEEDLNMVRRIWKYYRDGFSPKVAYQKAKSEVESMVIGTGGTGSKVIEGIRKDWLKETRESPTLEGYSADALKSEGDKRLTIIRKTGLRLNSRQLNELSEKIIRSIEDDRVNGIVALTPTTLMLAGAVSALALGKGMASISPIGVLIDKEKTISMVGDSLEEGSNVVVLTEGECKLEEVIGKNGFAVQKKWNVVRTVSIIDDLSVASFSAEKWEDIVKGMTVEDIMESILKNIPEEYLDATEKRKFAEWLLEKDRSKFETRIFIKDMLEKKNAKANSVEFVEELLTKEWVRKKDK